jgi:hypothetical protein
MLDHAPPCGVVHEGGALDYAWWQLSLGKCAEGTAGYRVLGLVVARFADPVKGDAK